MSGKRKAQVALGADDGYMKKLKLMLVIEERVPVHYWVRQEHERRAARFWML
jgi:hypothetical protein